MNIVNIAREDLSFTLEDIDSGFGMKTILIKPDGQRFGDDGELTGKSTDIGFRLDPETGVLFIGRTVEIDLRLDTVLKMAGMLPEKEAGWQVELNYGEQVWTFVLREANLIDRKLGIFKMILQLIEK